MYRYKNNAFRVLGLMPDASFSDIMRRVNEIKVRYSVGMDVSFPWDFTWMGAIERNEENITDALQRLEDPKLRLQEELSWFWFISSTDKQAFELLKERKRKEAHETWNSEASPYAPMSTTKLSALWNQAVLMHSILLEKEVNLRYGPRQQANPELSDSHWNNWRFVLNRFILVNSEEVFLQLVASKAKKINDPRLNVNKTQEIQGRFLSNVFLPNFFFISQALISKDYERVKKHANLINGIDLPVSVLKQGLNKILSYHISMVTECVEKAGKDLSRFAKSSKEDDVAFLYTSSMNQIGHFMQEASIVDINLMSDFVLVRDNAAQLLRNISLEVNNRFKNYSLAQEIIEKAVECAGSTYQKQRLQKDAAVIKANAQIQSAYKKAYIKLKSNNNSATGWGWLIAVGFFVIISFIGNFYEEGQKKRSVYPTSTSTSTTRLNVQKLGNEITTLKVTVQEEENQLKIMKEGLEQKENQITTLRSELNIMSGWQYNQGTVQYNKLVGEHNLLLEQMEKLRAQYQQDIQRHNSLVDAYNKRG